LRFLTFTRFPAGLLGNVLGGVVGGGAGAGASVGSGADYQGGGYGSKQSLVQNNHAVD